MSLNISLYDLPDLKPKICVFGCGGAGGNAVNNMINTNLDGVDFWVANTDAQSLEHALTNNRIQLGTNSTKGLGAGSHPEIGRAAAEESIDEITNVLQNYNMVFITAGMGGGTGTGAAPVIAQLAKQLNILTVGVVTKPFHFEGARRMKIAELGLEEMQKYVDTLIIIPNQNLFRIANEKTTFADAFKAADDVLHSGVRGITDLITMPGLINLDFADIRTVVGEMGRAMMGTGEAEGENRAIKASEAAISNPLLDNSSMKGAKAVLINITGGTDMTLYEVDEAANRIKEEASDATIIFGSAFNNSLQGKMRVSVVATGIDNYATSVQSSASSIFSAVNTNQRPQTEEFHSMVANEEADYGEIHIAEEEISVEDSFIPPKAVEPGLSSLMNDIQSLEPEVELEQEVVPNHLKQKAVVTNKGLFGRMAASLGMVSVQSDEKPRTESEEMFDIPSFMRRKSGER
jgi:cell division protein FtsZ